MADPGIWNDSKIKEMDEFTNGNLTDGFNIDELSGIEGKHLTDNI